MYQVLLFKFRRHLCKGSIDIRYQPRSQGLSSYRALGQRGETLSQEEINCIVLHCTALHCTALHCTVLYCTVLHCIALHCIALHCIVLYCIVLYCIVFYYPTAPRRVQITPKTSTNITRYLYSRGPVGQVSCR